MARTPDLATKLKVGALLALATGHASANVGIPVLAWSFQLSVIFLIPVIALEAFVVHRAIPLSLLRSFGLMLIANVLSTLAGAVLIIASVFIPIMATRGMFADIVTLLALVPLFFVSRWIESRYAVWRVKDRQAEQVRVGVHRANLASYACLAVVVVVRIVGHALDAPCVSPVFQGCYATVIDALRDMQINQAKKLARSGGEIGEGGDISGGTVLHRACRWGDADLVQLLLDRGLDVQARNSNGDTPLLLAAGRGGASASQVVKVLLAKGARIGDRGSGGRTALHESAYHGDAASAALLLEHGADPNAVNEEGYTPLHSQATGRNPEVVRLLLAKGAYVKARDKNGDTPLHTAAFVSDNGGAVKLLLEAGADVNAMNNRGLTPLDFATRDELNEQFRSRFAEVSKLLVAHGGRKSKDSGTKQK